MARPDDRSLTELKQEAERSRAEFTDNVGQLRSRVTETVADFRERVSPEAIKTEVSDYFRTRGERLLEMARRNPLQTAAIGAGLAYPLLGMLRSIPPPVLMVGAGLFLLGSDTGQKASRKLGAVANDLSDRIGAGAQSMRRSIHDAQDRASDGLVSAGDSVSSALSGLKQQTSTATDTASRGADQLKGAASAVAGSVAEGLGDINQKAGAAADAGAAAIREGAATVHESIGAAADFATGAATKIRNRTVEASKKAPSAITETIQQNPLLVGGIGLAIGMLLASALPRSAVERGIMGDASAEMQKRANAMAARGFDAAKDMASTVIDDVAHRADQEGLSSEGIQGAAEDLGRRVRKVAENATTAAFELSSHEKH